MSEPYLMVRRCERCGGPRPETWPICDACAQKESAERRAIAKTLCQELDSASEDPPPEETPPGRVLTEDEDGTLLTADGRPVICPLVSIGVVARSEPGNSELPLAYCNTRCAWCDSGHSPHGEVICGVNTTIGYLRRPQ